MFSLIEDVALLLHQLNQEIAVTTFLLSVGVLAMMAVFLGLRVIFAKDAEVRKPGCANARLFMEDQEACPVCGVSPTEECAQPESALHKAGGTQVARS